MDPAKYDAVVLTKPDGTEEKLTPGAFMAIPLTERVRLVSTGQVKFFKNDQRISAVEALRK